MCTKVVNIYKTKEPYIYIGRRGKGKDGYFGNPIKLEDGKSRQSVLKEYKSYLWNRVCTDDEFRTRLWVLRGHNLGCFCHPQLCHGDVIVDWLNANGPYKKNGTIHYMEADS